VDRVVASLLFEVSPLDPVTFLAVVSLLVSTTVGAIIIPAWRGANLDAVVGLRKE